MRKNQTLTDRVLEKANIWKAVKKVTMNAGSAGVDGMTTDEVMFEIAKNYNTICRKIRRKQFAPMLLREVHIPKGAGGERVIGVPTVIDRVLQQAVAQILYPLYTKEFSPNSYGYRNGMGAHDAIRGCLKYANQGLTQAVHLDIEDCFSSIDRSLLFSILRKKVDDPVLNSLIEKMCAAQYLYHGKIRTAEAGIPMGSPLSPLLCNIVLNEFDRYMQERGIAFVRYADDILILCADRNRATIAKSEAEGFLQNRLHFRTNSRKTSVAHISKVRYLGFGFRRTVFGIRACVHPDSKKSHLKKLAKIACSGKAGDAAAAAKNCVKGWRSYYNPGTINRKFFPAQAGKNTKKQLDNCA